jgi:hypothetical protein
VLRPLLLCLMVVSASRQPLLYYRGVVNAASFIPQGLPGGGVAQGSIFSLFGKGPGPAAPAGQLSFPLATTIGGAHAIPLSVSRSQINAIMPSDAPLGRASVRGSFNGHYLSWTIVCLTGAASGSRSVGRHSGKTGVGKPRDSLAFDTIQRK